MKKKIAFSLIELLITLIIIAFVTAAFAPVFTKKTKTNLAAVSKVGSGGVVKESLLFSRNDFPEGMCTLNEDGSIKVTVSPVGTRSIKCKFVVPKGVRELNAVLVGSGQGGDKAVTNTTAESITDAPSDTATSAKTGGTSIGLLQRNYVNTFTVDLYAGGGGGGGSYCGYSPSGQQYLSGGGGASGGHVTCTVPGQLSVYDALGRLTGTTNIVSYNYSIGIGGAGGAKSASDCTTAGNASRGGDSFITFTYFNGFSRTINVYGGNPGRGALPGQVGSSGEVNNPIYSVGDSQIVCSTAIQNPGGGFNDGGGIKGGSGTYGAGGTGGRRNSVVEAGKKGGNGHLSLSYSVDFDGAAAAGGAAGGMIHVQKIPVKEGNTINLTIGVGGIGKGGTGDGGSLGQKSILSYTSSSGGTVSITAGANGSYSQTAPLAQRISDPPTSVLAASQGELKFTNNSIRGEDTQYIVSNSISTGDDNIYCNKLNNYKYKDGLTVVDFYDQACKHSLWDNKVVQNAVVTSYGARGGSGMTNFASEVALGGAYSNASSDPNGATVAFRGPSLYGVQHGDYGSAGAGGGGGGWIKSTNVAGIGGDGQDGYIFLYWDQIEK